VGESKSENYPEGGSLALLTLGSQFGTVQFRQFPAERQSYPGAGLEGCHLPFITAETHEEVFYLLPGEPGPLVCHYQLQRVTVLSDSDSHILSAGGELQCVGDQVKDDFFHFVSVSPYLFTFRKVINCKPDPLILCRLAEVSAYALNKRSERELLYSQLHLPVLYFPEVKYLVYEPQHSLGIVLHEGQLISYLGLEPVVLQDVGYRRGDECERGTELVRNIREELQLQVGDDLFNLHLVTKLVHGEDDINCKRYQCSTGQYDQ